MSFVVRARALALPAFGLLLVSSCGSHRNNELGVALIEDLSENEAEPRGVQFVEATAADAAADYQLEEPPYGGGLITTMLVGSRPGLRARALVRFDAAAFPDSGTVVDSASVEWIVRDGYGATPPLNVLLVRIASDWVETTTDPDSLPAFDAAPFDSMSVSFPDAVAETLRIGLGAMAQAWVDDPSANYGMALVPADGQDSEVELSSHESGEPARLLLYTTLGGDVVTTSLPASADAFVLEKTGAFVSPVGVPGRLTVARGFPARTLLKFHWPDPGSRATINRAELTVFVDGAASFTNGFPVGVQRVLSEPWSTDSTETDPLLFGANTIDAQEDSVVFAVTGIVDALLTEENHGFQLRAAEERTDTDIIHLHGADTEVMGKAPRLRIWYTPGTGTEDQP